MQRLTHTHKFRMKNEHLLHLGDRMKTRMQTYMYANVVFSVYTHCLRLYGISKKFKCIRFVVTKKNRIFVQTINKPKKNMKMELN